MFLKKSLLFVFSVLLLISGPFRLAGDIVISESENHKFSFYGFLKLDLSTQDKGMNGMTFPRYAMPGDGNLLLTASHSRFGFKISGPELSSGLKLAATLEWDMFDPTTPNQMKVRHRQAFFTLQKGNSTFLLGQAWDVFSPLGPTTLMTNGYLWQTGNLGFRHAQARYTYTTDSLEFAASINDPASAAGWKAKLPVLQSRLGLKLLPQNNLQVGLSAAYGQTKIGGGLLPNALVDIFGLSLDWHWKLSSLTAFRGELASGSNLNYFLSRSGIFTDIEAFRGQKNTSFWAQWVFTPKNLSFWVSYAFELLGEERVLPGILKDSHCFFSGLQYNLGQGVSLGFEFSRFQSKFLSGDDLNTNQLLFSAVYSF